MVFAPADGSPSPMVFHCILLAFPLLFLKTHTLIHVQNAHLLEDPLANSSSFSTSIVNLIVSFPPALYDKAAELAAAVSLASKSAVDNANAEVRRLQRHAIVGLSNQSIVDAVWSSIGTVLSSENERFGHIIEAYHAAMESGEVLKRAESILYESFMFYKCPHQLQNLCCRREPGSLSGKAIRKKPLSIWTPSPLNEGSKCHRAKTLVDTALPPSCLTKYSTHSKPGSC
jgi:hypothetical protein